MGKALAQPTSFLESLIIAVESHFLLYSDVTLTLLVNKLNNAKPHV